MSLSIVNSAIQSSSYDIVYQVESVERVGQIKVTSERITERNLERE